jgi:hypothetical protein
VQTGYDRVLIRVISVKELIDDQVDEPYNANYRGKNEQDRSIDKVFLLLEPVYHLAQEGCTPRQKNQTDIDSRC